MTLDLYEFAELPLSGEGLIKLAEMCGLLYLKEEVDGEIRIKLLAHNPLREPVLA